MKVSKFEMQNWGCVILNKTSRAFCSVHDPSVHLRRAQAVELMRASYLSAAKSPMTMQIEDLDDMIRETNSRPSLLIFGYGVLGDVLGKVSSISPKACSAILTSIVNEVAEQSLNDSIREMQSSPTSNMSEDVRETLKYHRDFRGSMSADSAISATAHGDGSNSPYSFNVQAEAAKGVITRALVNAVKISDVL